MRTVPEPMTAIKVDSIAGPPCTSAEMLMAMNAVAAATLRVYPEPNLQICMVWKIVPSPTHRQRREKYPRHVTLRLPPGEGDNGRGRGHRRHAAHGVLEAMQ